jgi:signal transduction histidine kinase
MANEELEAKARAEKDLMNITAHELRTPTQSILANTEILRHAIGPALGFTHAAGGSSGEGSHSVYHSLASDIQPSEIVELVESSYRNAQRLQKLTKNILEVARIENKTARLEIETFDLNDLVKETMDDRIAVQNRESGERRRLVYSYETRQSALPVQADRTKTAEVLGNLLDNAERFSPEGGLIRVIADKRDQNFAVVTVKDGGSGIDPEILPRLFGKFATKTGTGLGLYISKAYVEAQGGTIGVENPGGLDGPKGATFSFTLPLAG